jgi:site-specific recombinase XerD
MSDEGPSAEVIVSSQALSRELVQTAASNARRSLSEASKRAYKADWARFRAWCAAFGCCSLPAAEPTIVTYLTAAARGYELAGDPVAPLRYSSLSRAYAAIRVYHDEGGEPLGTLVGVRNALKSIGREIGTAPKQKRGLTADQVTLAVAQLDVSSLMGVLDRAVLLLWFAVGQRRSNIAALRVDDVEFNEEGALITIRKSKTDQLGKGRVIGVTRMGGANCPVEALEAWLQVRDVGGKSLFGMTDAGVANIVKEAAASLGLDPREYAGHSMRRGFVTSAARAGQDVLTIMHTTGHRSVEQVQTYIETATPFDRHVGSTLLRNAGVVGGNLKGKNTLKATIGESVKPTLKKATIMSKVPASIAALVNQLGDGVPRHGPPLDFQQKWKAAEPEPPTGIPGVNIGAQTLEAIRDDIETHPTTGQPLRRRVVGVTIKPDYLRAGRPLDLAWVRKQANGLRANGRSSKLVAVVLSRVGVTRADGSAIDEGDVEKWLR